MPDEDEIKTPVKSSILNYVENFINKRDNEFRATAGDEEGDRQLTHTIDRNTIIIDTDTANISHDNLDSSASETTDIVADELDLNIDPVVETRPSDRQVYQQQVYLRQYQPPTPEPIDIEVKEIAFKPPISRPPIHVYVGSNQNRDAQRTPSPILIKSTPPQPLPSSNGPIIYNKYIPVGFKSPPQQIIIHHYPEMPPKPRPIVVEQWLPNKSAPKRVTYHRIDPEEFARNNGQLRRNRFIEYSKPKTAIEVEVVRLPIVKLKPEEHANQSPQLTKLDNIRSIQHDSNSLQWRI